MELEKQAKKTPKVDILIIGAGLSGLVAAVNILQKEPSLQIKILEATNRIGGQIGATKLGEIGGKWITEDQYHIYQLAKQLQIPIRKRVLLAPKLKRCWDIDRGTFAGLIHYELSRYLSELDLKVQYYKPGRYEAHSHANITMNYHISKRLFFSKSREFMFALVLLICGVDANDISYAEFMSICYTCGSVRTLIDIYLECPETLLEISSASLLHKLLEALKYTEILYWRRVYEIHHFKDSVEVLDSEHVLHTAEAVILAIPWNAIDDIYFAPALPMELRKLPAFSLQNTKQMITSFLAKYNAGHWRTAGYSGNFFCCKPLLTGQEYRPTTYMGFVVHEEGLEPLIPTIALEKLATYFGKEMLLPLDFQQRSYELSSLINKPFTTAWNRIVFASSAAAGTTYRGCLGGAVQSGLRAAMNTLLVLRPQTVVWQDVAEVQRSAHLFRRYTGWLTLWLSSWNLYNVSCNSLMLAVSLTLFCYLYRRK